MYEDGNYKVLIGSRYYPLFTFMFQSSFYYHLKKSSFTILKQNNDLIKFYFDSFKIVNWKPYLLESYFKTHTETNEKSGINKSLHHLNIMYMNNYRILLSAYA
jgi:hypothetical protein